MIIVNVVVSKFRLAKLNSVHDWKLNFPRSTITVQTYATALT